MFYNSTLTDSNKHGVKGVFHGVTQSFKEKLRETLCLNNSDFAKNKSVKVELIQLLFSHELHELHEKKIYVFLFY